MPRIEPVDSMFEPLPSPSNVAGNYQHQRAWDEPPSDDEPPAVGIPIPRPTRPPHEEPRIAPQRDVPITDDTYPPPDMQAPPRVFNLNPARDSLHINERLTIGKPSAAFPSHQPIDDDDPSLSRFFREHVAPPRLVRNYIAFICERERIHPSRVELFINMVSEETSTEELVQLNKNATLRVGPRECGSSEKNPLLVTVEADEGMESQMKREDVIHPLPLWVEGGRAVGTGAVVAGHGFLVGLKAFGRFL
ncbi:hypothetical protein FRB99_004712, partial [Tulasnella sp. 403]